MSLSPIPEGYHSLTPYLIVDDIQRLITFLEKAFGAGVHHKITRADGRINHADLVVGNSHIMMGQAQENFPALPCMMYLYVEDVDAQYARALEAGGVSIMEPTDPFYGARDAGIKGPSGNYWWIGTRFEEVAPEEMQRRSLERDRQRAEKTGS